MNWTEYRAYLANELVITDPNGLILLDAMLPQIVAHAEERIYKDSDFDFLGTRRIDTIARTTRGERELSIPTDFVIIEQIALIRPPSAQPDQRDRDTFRVVLLRTGPAFLDIIWPHPSRTKTPRPYETYFAVFSQQVTDGITGNASGIVKIAPTPDDDYIAEIRGTFDPTPASAENPHTFLLTYYPSLFFAASMAIATGALKQNFGAQSDDPRQAISWEIQYQTQKEVAMKRSQRQHSWGPGWTSFGPSPLGTMSRFQPMAMPHPGAAPAGGAH